MFDSTIQTKIIRVEVTDDYPYETFGNLKVYRDWYRIVPKTCHMKQRNISHITLNFISFFIISF